MGSTGLRIVYDLVFDVRTTILTYCTILSLSSWNLCSGLGQDCGILSIE